MTVAITLVVRLALTRPAGCWYNAAEYREEAHMAIDLEFLRRLCMAPGPTGFEAPVQELVRARVAALAPAQGDPLGNVWAEFGPSGGAQVAVVGHADQIGLIVTFIDDNGFLSFATIGGVDPQLLPGREFVIHSAAGPVRAVGGRRPTHVIPEAERGKAPEINEQFLDIGARSRDEALARVAVGDPVTFAGDFIELGGGVCASRAFDNRAGVYVAVRGLELYAQRVTNARYIAVSSVHEETTLMGAKALTHRLCPQVLIVVDGDFASDTPAADAKKLGGEIRLGGGPALGRGTGSNEALLALARDVADEEGIAVQIKAYGGATQTDADELMAAGETAALSIGIPLRYMHSPLEVIDSGDVEAAAQLVAALVVRLGDVSGADGFLPQRRGRDDEL
jgi:endoglucanase